MKQIYIKKERISVKTKEAMSKPEVRERYLEGLKTRNTKSNDPEVRKKRSDSMKGKNAGKLTVRYANDPNGKCFHVTKDDPRYLSGEVVHASVGLKKGPPSDEHREKKNEKIYSLPYTK